MCKSFIPIAPHDWSTVSLPGSMNKDIDSRFLFQQPSANKEVLQKRYKSDDLFVATTGYKSDDKMSLSCSAGDLVGVIKRQDPLGSASRWFCDDGGKKINVKIDAENHKMRMGLHGVS